MHLRYASLLGHLASAIAVPTARSDPIPGNYSLTLPRPRDVSKHYSVQIFYGVPWSVFYGPYGIAADPCNLQQFTWSGDYTDAKVAATDTDDPPVPAQAFWNGTLPKYAGEDSCMIRKKGNGPPTLICGPNEKNKPLPSPVGPFTYIDDCKKDVQYKDPAMICNGNKYYRAWTVEYFG